MWIFDFFLFLKKYNLLSIVMLTQSFWVCSDSKNLPLIRSYDSLQALSREIDKHERGHDLVIAVSPYLFLNYYISV